MQSIEQRVDVLTGIAPRGKSTARKGMAKRTKYVLGVFVALVLVASASACLLVLYNQYIGSQSGDIEVTGIGTNIYFDGVPMSTQTFSIPMDITTLVAGDSEVYEHSAEVNIGDGDWDMSFMANWDFSNPEHEHHGFYYDILDDMDISVIDSTIFLKAGEPITYMYFTYDLDMSFLHTNTPLPFDLDVILSVHINIPPDAIDDTYEVAGYGTQQDCEVLLNDLDMENDDLEIISLTQPIDGSAWISGTIPSQYIIYESDAYASPTLFTYTISDGNGGTDTATVTLT